MRMNFHSIASLPFVAFIFVSTLFVIALGWSLWGLHDTTTSVDRLETHTNARVQALSQMYQSGLLSGIATRNKVFNPSLTLPAKVVARSNHEFEAALDPASGAPFPAAVLLEVKQKRSHDKHNRDKHEDESRSELATGEL